MAVATRLALVGLFFIPGISAIRWSNDLQDGQLVYTCAGENLILPWSISKENESEGIADIQWFFQGQESQEMIAILAHDNFILMPAFQGRVQHVATGGLLLNRLTVGDTGNYTIEIKGHDPTGTFYTVRRTAIVHVGDSLMTTDGKIHVSEEPLAKWDDSDRNFHIVLSCGTFTYLTYPPFEVEWTHPDGIAENSTGYKDGQFYLLLANPIMAGNYTCRIPQQSSAMACLHAQMTKTFISYYNVNGLEGRLTVLEAQQALLRTENSQLKGENADLKNEVTSLENQLTQFKNETLEDRQIISFAAHMHSTKNYGSSNVPIVLSTVTNNNGGFYNSTTGKFTVPKNGTYVFMATTYSSSSSYYATARIMSSDSTLCTIDSAVRPETGSCQITVSLHEGEQVWLNSFYSHSSNNFAEGTSFSGFLLQAD